MDDMDAFERQVAGQVRRFAGPRRPVNDAAIFATVTTHASRRRFRAAFSAAGFVVAGAIVVLLGGFLLMGGWRQPPDDGPPVVGASAPATMEAEPTTTPSSEPGPTPEAEGTPSTTRPVTLADLDTRELQPGVFRVLSDGVRDLSSLPFGTVRQDRDGGIWLGSNDAMMIKLGDSGSPRYEPPEAPQSYPSKAGDWHDLRFVSGGTFWLVRWERFRDSNGGRGVSREAAAMRIMRVDGEKARECSLKRMPEGFHPVGVDAAGGLWGTTVVREVDSGAMYGPEKVLSVARFDCKTWEAGFPTFGVMPLPSRNVSVADDGSVWVLAVPEDVFIDALRLPLSEQSNADVWPAHLYLITPEAASGIR